MKFDLFGFRILIVKLPIVPKHVANCPSRRTGATTTYPCGCVDDGKEVDLCPEHLRYLKGRGKTKHTPACRAAKSQTRRARWHLIFPIKGLAGEVRSLLKSSYSDRFIITALLDRCDGNYAQIGITRKRAEYLIRRTCSIERCRMGRKR